MAIVILALLVLVVAIDTLRRLDRHEPSAPREQSVISTQKIIVDLTKRF
jgi:hypothetical protein